MKTVCPSQILIAAFALAAITFSLAVRSQAQTTTILKQFDQKSDGGFPYGGVLIDASGNVYGTTTRGGSTSGTFCGLGCGVVFELSKLSTGRWSETVLRDLPTDGGSDAGLIEDAAGNFYGTTLFGGSTTPCPNYGNPGCGTVFELSNTSSGWKRTVLYAFTGGADGSLPYSKLISDAAGNLYGTAGWGGNVADCQGGGCGVVYKLSPNGDGTWTESTLYTFTGGTDGGLPRYEVTLDSEGNLYGTTVVSTPGYGTVFELTPTSSGPWNLSTLYTFQDGADGASPGGGVVLDSAGNIYGVAGQAGNLADCRKQGCGTVFELSPNGSGGWTENTILTFTGTNGSNPVASLVWGAAGTLYGTTSAGGAHKSGVVFKLTPGSGGTWTQTILHGFQQTPDDGENPGPGALAFDSTGAIYGTTVAGGKYGYGTVYKIEP